MSTPSGAPIARNQWDACPTCHIRWDEHGVWNTRDTHLFSAQSPFHVPGIPVCRLRNGQLVNIRKMLERWRDPSKLDQYGMIRAEIARRDRDGWWDGRAEPLDIPSNVVPFRPRQEYDMLVSSTTLRPRLTNCVSRT